MRLVYRLADRPLYGTDQLDSHFVDQVQDGSARRKRNCNSITLGERRKCAKLENKNIFKYTMKPPQSEIIIIIKKKLT